MNDDNRLMEEVWKRIEERERSLKILGGLERKDESNMLPVAKEFLGRMGIKGLFCGMADVIAVSMMISVCIFIGICIYLRQDPQYACCMAFIFSPTLYACIFCLAYVKETQTNTINVLMSCRYTFYHVLLFRMLLNSGLAIVFNLVYICTLDHLFDMNPVKALSLSFSSLMLFSIMLLKTVRRKNKLLKFARTTILWFGVNLMFFNGSRHLYMGFLEQIPFSVLVMAAVASGAFYYRELKKMIDVNEKLKNGRYINA